MAEFSAAVVKEQDPGKVTDTFLQALIEGFHPREVALYESDGANKRYLKRGSFPTDWPRVESDVIATIKQGSCNGQAFLIPTHSNGWQAALGTAGIRVVVPLQSRGEPIGCLLLGGKQSDQPYSDEDLTLLGIMANQAAVVYERPRLLREVSGGFVHEVKTPLSKISLPAELTYLEIEKALQNQGASEELLTKIQKRMKYIIDQVKVAGHRVDALRELSAAGEGQRDPVRLSPIVQKCLASVDDLLERTQARVELDLPESLPPVSADPEQLEIVFANLLKNAAEAMAGLSASNPRKIHVQGLAEADQVVIKIRDTGPGIPREDRERIFQSHYSTKGPNGAGMGLFLCRQIIQAHNGTIEVLSNSNSGATFEIRLPSIIS